MRPVRLGDDVRDIESLGGSPPSRRLARAHLLRISVSLAFIRGLRPVLFLRLLRAGDADRFVARIVPPRLSRDLTAGTSLHDDSAVVQHPGRTEGRRRGMIPCTGGEKNVEVDIYRTRTQDSAILVLRSGSEERCRRLFPTARANFDKRDSTVLL